MTTAFPTLADVGLTVEQRAEILAAVINSNLDAVISIDDTGAVLEWSRSAEDMFLWCRSDAIGRRLEDLIIPPGQVAAHREGLARWQSTGVSPIVGRRVRVEAAERCGNTFPVELTVTHIEVDGRHYFTARVRDLTREVNDAAHIHLLNRQLYHRHGNDFAVIGSLVRHSRTMTEAADRVEALGRTLGMVRAAGDKGADLADIVAAEVAAYGADRLRASGPRVRLSPAAAQTLGICIHEMATNAVKHGAFRPRRWWRRHGHVDFTWAVVGGELVMGWRESGGPPPAPPQRRVRGFGSTLVARDLKLTLGGKMHLNYRRSGLVAQTRIPVDRLT